MRGGHETGRHSLHCDRVSCLEEVNPLYGMRQEGPLSREIGFVVSTIVYISLLLLFSYYPQHMGPSSQLCTYQYQ